MKTVKVIEVKTFNQGVLKRFCQKVEAPSLLHTSSMAFRKTNLWPEFHCHQLNTFIVQLFILKTKMCSLNPFLPNIELGQDLAKNSLII